VELYHFGGQSVILGVSEGQSNLPRTVPKNRVKVILVRWRIRVLVRLTIPFSSVIF